MIKKIFIFWILFSLITSCDYKPIYSSKEKNKFNIQIENYEGDLEVNNRIISKLRTHKNLNNQLFKISFTTDYKKIDLSKDITGKIQNYEMIIKSDFKIYSSDIEKSFSIKEIFIMKNFEDDFEEKNYERKIKENISNLIYQRLINQLTKIQ